MPRYRAFGVRLDCDFPLPELPEVDSTTAADWRVETRVAQPPVLDAVLIGTDTVYGDVVVRAYSAPGVLRVAFDDTGAFDVRRDERTIAWYPGPRSDPPAVRADLLGRVISFAAHAEGRLPLHASAVSIGGRAIAFLGPKHAGKSTMALALVRHGARLLTDDTLIVRLAGKAAAIVSPGVQHVRLWDDSARALGAEPAPWSAGAKPTIAPLGETSVAADDVPLAACYVLGRAEATDDDVVLVRRERLPAVHAAMAILQSAKLGPLAAGAEAVAQLDRVTVLASSTPCYAAIVHRDLGQLSATAATIARWHCNVTAPNAGAVR